MRFNNGPQDTWCKLEIVFVIDYCNVEVIFKGLCTVCMMCHRKKRVQITTYHDMYPQIHPPQLQYVFYTPKVVSIKREKLIVMLFCIIPYKQVQPMTIRKICT